MRVQRTIEDKIAAALVPSHLDVINESHMHSVPPGSESHFRVVVVSDRFDGLPLIKRHQAVNQILEHELREQIHALSLHTLTVEEWTRRGGVTLASPDCHGGSKTDH